MIAVCRDCCSPVNVGPDRICVECRKCRAQIPPEATDPDWDTWLKPIIDLYGPGRRVGGTLS